MEIFERELKLSKRNGTPLAFIMVDLDFFKQINDKYGHKMGDKALEASASALQDALRETDYLGRYGGEEFAIVLPNCTEQDAADVSERCREVIESASIQYKDELVKLTASVGVASESDTSTLTPDTIIERADQALYRSKKAGRNRVSFFSEPLLMGLVNA